ncbi:MAG: methylated-DNA--[protein]-cysteine S-methyltransferase [Candidatus Omnitrophica bacterium]|nr:methylated-DNA--[protein]-cysteine S-methyltransferase [Candidatus Omnitrophota bacterium]
MDYFDLFDTSLGPIGMVWRETLRAKKELVRLFLPRSKNKLLRLIRRTYPGCTVRSWGTLISDIKKAMRGKRVDFRYVETAHDQLTALSQKIYEYQRKIPYGKVISYSVLARRIGVKNAARAVGNAQAANPFPLIVPCHRVIKNTGEIGGFQGGVRLKIALLALEGIIINKKNGCFFVAEKHVIK